MTINETETLDLGQVAVVAESFAPAGEELSVEVVDYDATILAVDNAPRHVLDVAGQRITVVAAAESGRGADLVAHLQTALPGATVRDDVEGAAPTPGTPVVVIAGPVGTVALVSVEVAPLDGGAPVGVGADASAPSPVPDAGLVSLGMLRDVPMEVHAELGRTELPVAEILQLAVGSVIELDRTVGSPVDVVVNGALIGRGEVVVIDEEYGIRITEIVARGSDSL